MAAKRGRKPQGPHSNKPAVLTTRITKELREKLDRARKEHPLTLSLSQEVEVRLRKSFNAQGVAEEIFGDQETYGVALMIVETMNQMRNMTGRHWAEDAFTLNACALAIGNVLRGFQASDDADPPPHLSKYFRTPEEAGEAVAGGVLDQIRMADQVPIDRPGHYHSIQLKSYPRIKEALGELAGRLK